MKGCIAALALVLTAGCATAPKSYDISSSRTYNASYDQVWSKLIGLLAQKNIPLKEIAKDSGVIYAEALRFDDGQADCGSPGMLKPIARIANINVLVQTVGGQQLVSVNSRFVETRYNGFDYSTSQVECNSKGVVEQGILNAIGPGPSAPAAYSAPPMPQAAVATSRSASDRSIQEQLDELKRTPMPYEEYQRRYREITGQ